MDNDVQVVQVVVTFCFLTLVLLLNDIDLASYVVAAVGSMTVVAVAAGVVALVGNNNSLSVMGVVVNKDKAVVEKYAA